MKSEKLQKTICRMCGERISLKPFSLKQLNEFYKLYLTSQSKWNEFISLCFKSIRDAEIYLKQQTEEDFFTGYFITEKTTGKLVGFILGDELDDNSISVTFAIGQKFGHRGYARDALKLFEGQMKNAGYKNVIAFCDGENRISENILRRADYHWAASQKIPLEPCAMELKVWDKQL